MVRAMARFFEVLRCNKPSCSLRCIKKEPTQLLFSFATFLVKGRVVEIYGPEASGKTTLALHVIAEAQKSGGYCAFVDAEHALDPALAEAIGVNTDNLLISQPDCGEQALSLVDTLIRSGSIDVIVVDSVAALVPKSELDGEMGDAHMALQARLMSQALRKMSHSLSLSQTILIFTNQVRSKLSTFGGFGGPTEVTSGGNALKFYASVRLNVRRVGLVKKGDGALMAEQQQAQPTEAERGSAARVSSRSPMMEQHQPHLDSPSMSPPAIQPSPSQQQQGQKDEMMTCVVALEAALLPCLPARELQAVDRSVYSSHQIDVERHAREFMEAAKKLQVFFIGLQREEQLSKEERLRKDITIMEEELKTKSELIKKHEKLIEGWRKELKDQLEKHVTELERV